jgi:glycosyltransferase involved in cell wall biosynthesis
MSPLLSVGIPVYNGEKFIQAAIDSILAQTFTDFELIICDNRSTDQTGAICQKYAAADPRVRYFLNEKNLGAAGNFDRVFTYATGKYFKWQAHDDLIQATYLERCIDVLESDPTIALCHSQTQLIDDPGQPLEASDKDRYIRYGDDKVLRVGLDAQDRKLGSTRVDERFRAIVLNTRWCYEIFGVIRSDMLRRTTLQEAFYGTDKVLLAELSVLGRFDVIPEPLFVNRRHLAQSGSLKTAKARERWNNPLGQRSHVFPRLLCLKGYIRAALHSQMTLRERLGCFLVIASYVLRLGRWRNVIREYTRGLMKNRPERKETSEPIPKTL